MIINTSLSLVKKSRVFVTYTGLFISSIVVIASMLLANSLYLEEDMSLIFLCITMIGLFSLIDFNLSKTALFCLNRFQEKTKRVYSTSVILITVIIGFFIVLLLWLALYFLFSSIDMQIMNGFGYHEFVKLDVLPLILLLLPILIFSQSIQVLLEVKDLFFYSSILKSLQAVSPYLMSIYGYYIFDNIGTTLLFMVLSRVLILCIVAIWIYQNNKFIIPSKVNAKRMWKLFSKRFSDGLLSGTLTPFLMHFDRLLAYLILKNEFYNLYMLASELVLKYVGLVVASSSVFVVRTTEILRARKANINIFFLPYQVMYFIFSMLLIVAYVINDSYNLIFTQGEEYFLIMYTVGFYYSISALAPNILLVARGRFKVLSMTNALEVIFIMSIFYVFSKDAQIALFASILIKGFVNYLIQSIYLYTEKIDKKNIALSIAILLYPLFIFAYRSNHELIVATLVVLLILSISYMVSFYKKNKNLIKQII
jgi:hypothetical protein